MHMTLSSNNHEITKSSSVPVGLGANRLLVEIGDRFDETRKASEHELCLAADSGKCSVHMKSMPN